MFGDGGGMIVAMIGLAGSGSVPGLVLAAI